MPFGRSGRVVLPTSTGRVQSGDPEETRKGVPGQLLPLRPGGRKFFSPLLPFIDRLQSIS